MREGGDTQKKNIKSEKGGSVGVRQYHDTPGQYIGSSMGVFRAFWSADLQSILDVRICSSALSAREYQLLRVCGRLEGAWTGSILEREAWEIAVLVGL